MAIDDGAPAPALADALVPAAAAWLRLRSGQSLDRALPAVLAAPRAGGRTGEEARMAGAVRDLVACTVRRCAVVDYLLAQLVHRKAQAPVLGLLAVALAQLLARSYADFTLVDQAVRAARARPQTAGGAGLVNAVLREFLRRRAALEAQALDDPARRYNVPPWWLARVQDEYGARAPALLAAQLEEPPLVLRINVRRTTLTDYLALLAQAGLGASRVGTAAVWLHRATAVERIPGFAEGLVSVQDAGAQLAAPWVGVRDGMRVLDACAAPGGKTAHLLELAECHVDAVEQDEERARRIGANLQRLGLAGAHARVCVADALEPERYWNGQPYDRILLDAPCSASGVVRRHPDAVWLRRSSDVAKLATQQAKMLQTLWPLLAPAGRLLYVVCSVFAEEGSRQIAAFLRQQPGAREVLLVHLNPQHDPQANPPGEPAGVQLLPTSAAIETTGPVDVGPSDLPALHDGFFYALLEKT
jgi:16S rRNA (cytosine967-C5)-methyltransferase